MALYIGIYWVLFASSLAIYFISRRTKNKRLAGQLSSITALFAILGVAFLIMSFLTEDPFFEPLGVPKEYEWLAGLLSSGFALWQFYLSPLKERVIRTEAKVGSIIMAISSIKEDVGLIKAELINKK